MSKRFSRESLQRLHSGFSGSASLNSVSQSGISLPHAQQPRAFTTLGRKRHHDDNDYFDEEEKPVENPDDLEYQPAPGSPSGAGRSHEESEDTEAKPAADDDDDPLDSFMADIDRQVKVQEVMDKHRAENPTTFPKNKKDTKGIRDDIEQEDELESYMRWMEEHPEVGVNEDEEDERNVEYDADGNAIYKNRSKSIDPLPTVDHSAIQYPSFERNLYVEHDEIAKLNDSQTADLRKKLGVKVSGYRVPRPVCSFAHFSNTFDARIMRAIQKSGYSEPTPIQAQAIPVALSGRDLIGVAKTGSGKTCAYVWPALVHVQERLAAGDVDLTRGPLALLVAPTRELAVQIHSETQRFAKVLSERLSVVCAYGGGNMYEQQCACEAGCHVLVATPGRLIDLVLKRSTVLFNVSFLVFDEADRLLALGFETQVRSISSHVRPDRQTLMFSATFKRRVERVARDTLCDPVKVVHGEHAGEANADVSQIVEVFNRDDEKFEWLRLHLVEFCTWGSVLVFVTTKAKSEEVHRKLKQADVKCVLIHGDMHQLERNEVITAFRKREVHVLIATDVAARGLDIPSIRVVINYDPARDIDTHVHRIGRTGRAGEKGSAFTLLLNNFDREFASQLVRQLESLSQPVSDSLLNMAMQNAKFRAARSKHSEEPRARRNFGGRGLGFHEPDSDAAPFPGPSTSGGGSGGGGGGGSIRASHAAAVKDAMMSHYKRQFVSSGVDGGYQQYGVIFGDQTRRAAGAGTGTGTGTQDSKPSATLGSRTSDASGQSESASREERRLKRSRWDS